MPQGAIDGRSSHQSRITDTEPNHGGKGKLNADQLQERIQLHAKRLALGFPTVEVIAEHWGKKYGITMHFQSEAEWARTHNADILLAQEGMIESGEIALPKISDHLLTNTLADGARNNALILKQVKDKTREIMKSIDGCMDVYKIIGITREQYLAAEDDERVVWDKKASLELSAKKTGMDILKNLSKVGKDSADSLTEMIKLAHDINKSSHLKAAMITREAKILNEKMLSGKGEEGTDMATLMENKSLAELRIEAGID